MKKTSLMILFWDLDIGGIQTVIHDLVIYLNNIHPEVEISILLRNKTDNQITKDIQRKTRATLYSAAYRGKISVLNRVYFLLWFMYLYIKLKPDICLTFLDLLSVITIVVRKLFFWRDVKIVLNEGIVTSKNNEINKRPLWFWNWCISFFYKYADTIIVPSNACKTDLVFHFSLPEHKIRIGRNWTLLSKRESRRKIYDLVYVGRFDKEKNMFALLDVVKCLRKKFPHITLCLVGKGKEEQQLRKEVVDNHLGENIIFAGYHPDVVPYLNKSKVFVTTTQNEGVPLTLLEAGSQQLPIVVTRFIGSDEVVKHEQTGFIADSVGQMCQQITTVLRNSKLRRKIGIQAQKFVQSHYGRESLKLFVRYLLDI